MNQDLQVPYLTPLEFADRFRICRKTVYRLLKRGLIKATRVGKQWRIPREEVETFAPSRARSQEVQR